MIILAAAVWHSASVTSRADTQLSRFPTIAFGQTPFCGLAAPENVVCPRF
jgi:hypothetical protein